MEVIILAGGLGTRLKSVVNDVPKVMALVNNKPFLEYILDDLSNYDVDKIILAVGYKKEIIQQYFGNKYKGIEIVYSEEDKPLGTGGAIKNVLSLVENDEAIVMNGDIYTKINYNDLFECYKRKKANLMLVIKHMNNFDRYGSIELKDDKIIKFREKEPVESGFMSVGCYIFNKNLLNGFKSDSKFSIENDFFSKYVIDNKIDYYYYSDIFVDIGIPEDYNLIKKLLK